jgi:hypothetical protein
VSSPIRVLSFWRSGLPSKGSRFIIRHRSSARFSSESSGLLARRGSRCLAMYCCWMRRKVRMVHSAAAVSIALANSSKSDVNPKREINVGIVSQRPAYPLNHALLAARMMFPTTSLLSSRRKYSRKGSSGRALLVLFSRLPVSFSSFFRSAFYIMLPLPLRCLS